MFIYLHEHAVTVFHISHLRLISKVHTALSTLTSKLRWLQELQARTIESETLIRRKQTPKSSAETTTLEISILLTLVWNIQRLQKLYYDFSTQIEETIGKNREEEIDPRSRFKVSTYNKDSVSWV